MAEFPDFSMPWAYEAVPVSNEWDRAYDNLCPPSGNHSVDSTPRTIAKDYRGRIVTRSTIMAVPARGDQFGRLVEDPSMDRLCEGLGPNFWQNKMLTKTPHIRPIRSYVQKVGRILARRWNNRVCIRVCGWWADAKKAFYNYNAKMTSHDAFIIHLNRLMPF